MQPPTKLKNSTSVVEITPIAKSEYEEAEYVLAKAFVKNPFFGLMFGSGANIGRFKLFNRWMLNNEAVKTIVAKKDGTIAGVLKYADWPNCEPTGMRIFSFLIDTIRAWRFRTIYLFPSMFFSGFHPKKEHRHLIILGVLPQYGGQGIGSMLLSKFNNEADKDGIGAFLETDTKDALRLYKRYDYVEEKHTKFFGFHIWYLSRNM